MKRILIGIGDSVLSRLVKGTSAAADSRCYCYCPDACLVCCPTEEGLVCNPARARIDCRP